MNATQQQIKAILEEVASPDPTYYSIKPAPEAARQEFAERAHTRGVPAEVVAQLLDFYAVADGFSYEFNLGFFSCEDEILFEWWDEKELWLSLMHSDVIRWSKGKFCVGDASNVSYSEADEYPTLLELLVGCSRYIKEIEAEAPDEENDF